MKLTKLVGNSQNCVVEGWYSERMGMSFATKGMDTKSDPKAIESLQREVDILRDFKYYHSIRILGSFFLGDWFYIVEEPLASCDLDTYLKYRTSAKVRDMDMRYGTQISSVLPRIMGCLAHGLLHIHKEERVRHKDIKPSNILLEGFRVFYADFGISRAITETRSGSTGPSSKSIMYTSPETAGLAHRNKSCDIFSLACVYAEIFTVYKGRTCAEFLAYRKEKFPQSEGYFHKTIPAVYEWLDELVTERCDVQLTRLLRTMFSINPDDRPDAEKVWKTLTSCTRSNADDRFFCGPCCMPLLRGDVLLPGQAALDPSETEYTLPMGRDVVWIPEKKHTSRPFSTEVPAGKRPGIDWVRNLRHWDSSILDVVKPHEYPHLLARKKAISNGNDEEFQLAQNEATILKEVKHRHIVTLYSTYRQGNILTLLFEPAADYDLRSYLELVELLDWDRGLLNRSFGYLASAVACLHDAGYDHGDIRRENILVHKQGNEYRIFLSKLSFGRSKSKRGGEWWRIENLTGRLSVGTRQENSKDVQEETEHYKIPLNPSTAQYRPPEWKPADVAQFAADIFSLGCVFIEIYTVLCGKKVRDFKKIRLDDHGRSAYQFNIDKARQWLSQLEYEQDYETKTLFQDLIFSMIDEDPKRRPTAYKVSQTLRKCTDINGMPRCGKYCMASGRH